HDRGGVRSGRRCNRHGTHALDGERFLERAACPLDAAPRGGASEAVRIAANERHDLEAAARPEAGNLGARAEPRAGHDDAQPLPAHGHADPNAAASTMCPVYPVAICAASHATDGTTASGLVQPVQSKPSPSSRVASSVFTAPGRSALTAIPRAATSGANAVVNRSMAALATEYARKPGGIAAVAAWSAPPDEMLTMLPPSRAVMGGTTSFARMKRLRTLAAIDSSHASSESSSKEPRAGAIALFTNT